MEREIFVEEEREKSNKIIIFNFTIVVRTVSYLSRYYSSVPIFLAYGTPHEAHILGFDVLNAKNLTYDTLATYALTTYGKPITQNNYMGFL